MTRTSRGTRLRVGLGSTIVLAAAVTALFAPALAPYDPNRQSLTERLRPPAWSANAVPGHWLGTDNVGRDVLSRLIFGARISILVGVLAMTLAGTIGTTLGTVAGYRGGRLDQVIMRLADAQLAFPDFLLAILIVATLGGGTVYVVLVLGVSGWMVYARVAYGLARAIRSRPYVDSAVAQGAGDAHIITRHVVPQLVPALAVISTLQVAQMMLAETALSFLGVGIPPPTASWGNMLAEGRDRLAVAPWIANLAGLAIVIVVWGINLLGAGLRDALDPAAAPRGR